MAAVPAYRLAGVKIVEDYHRQDVPITNQASLYALSQLPEKEPENFLDGKTSWHLQAH